MCSSDLRRCFAVELDLQYADVILKRCEAEGMNVELAWRPSDSVSSVLDSLEGVSE